MPIPVALLEVTGNGKHVLPRTQVRTNARTVRVDLN